MKSLSVASQIKATGQFFPVALIGGSYILVCVLILTIVHE